MKIVNRQVHERLMERGFHKVKFIEERYLQKENSMPSCIPAMNIYEGIGWVVIVEATGIASQWERNLCHEMLEAEAVEAYCADHE